MCCVKTHRVLSALLDVLFPPRCVCCGAPGPWHCARCRSVSHPLATVRGAMPILLAQDPPSRVAVQALYALKYESVRAAASPLVSLVATALAAALRTSQHVVLVPIPTDAARVRARGFDQAVLLAQAAGALLHLPVAGLLERARSTTSQVGLGADARRVNLDGAFRVTATLPRAYLLLVDDVVTTGATIDAAAAALAHAGAESVGAVALFGRTA